VYLLHTKLVKLVNLGKSTCRTSAAIEPVDVHIDGVINTIVIIIIIIINIIVNIIVDLGTKVCT